MFQTVFSVLNEGVVIQNGNAEITAVNPAAVKMLGLCAAELLGKSLGAIALKFIGEDGMEFPPDVFPSVVTARSGKPRRDVVTGVYRVDGTLIWLAVNSQPLLSKGASAPYPVATIFSEISGSELAGIALRESENYQRLLEQQKLIQTSLDGFWVARAADARILETNDAFCNMVGYSREELLTMCISDLEADESPAETAAHIKKVVAIGRDRFETRHRHKLGHLVDLEVSSSYSEMNGGEFLVFARNITERKQAEAQLMQSECEFRTLAENLPDNIVRYNLEGVTTYVNPVLERTLGDLASAMIGTTPREYHPDGSYEDYAQLLDAVLASGEAGELEKILSDPDGATSVHQIRMVPERGENGEVVGVLAIGRDITERKRMEQALVAREQEFRSLAESSLDSIIRYNLDGRIRYLNCGLLNYFGLSAADVIGRLPKEVWPDGRYAEIERAIARTIETGEVTTVEFCAWIQPVDATD